MTKKYNNLRAMLAITKASLLSSLRNPSTIVFGFLFPLVFILAFGFLGGSQSKLQVFLTPESSQDNPVVETLKAMPNIELVSDMELTEAEDDLSKGRLAGILTVTSNLDIQDRPAFSVNLDVSEASIAEGKTLQATLEGIVDEITLRQLQLEYSFAEVHTDVLPGREYKTIDFILPGQLGFSLLSSGVFATAFVFIILKQTLVLKRFFATPINKTYILLAEGLSRLIIALVQASVIILFGKFFFGFTLVHGVVTFIYMLGLSALGLAIFLGLGFVVSSVAKNENAVPAVANLITMPQFLLAGTFFPIETFPTWLQPVSRILPLTYLNNAFRAVAFEGANLSAITGDLIVLLVWGLIIYVLAIKLFKWD